MSTEDVEYEFVPEDAVKTDSSKALAFRQFGKLTITSVFSKWVDGRTVPCTQ